MYRIMLPLDGSELSERALGFGARLARSINGEIELVHVIEQTPPSDLSRDVGHKAAEQYFLSALRRLPTDLTITTRVTYGNPSDAILALVDAAPATLIVMSTHGRGGLGRLMHGSVADKVMRGASVPVALVRESTPPSDKPLQTVLVALDGSALAEATLPLAIELAERAPALISLVRVVEPLWLSSRVSYAPEMAYLPTDQGDILNIEEQLQSDARAYLERVARGIRARGVPVVWEIRDGLAADEILRAAETTSADVILLSTHGRGGIRRWALGSVTDEVLHRGTIPILAIPPHIQTLEGEHLSDILSSMS